MWPGLGAGWIPGSSVLHLCGSLSWALQGTPDRAPTKKSRQHITPDLLKDTRPPSLQDRDLLNSGIIRVPL